jgi:hypothetical protein
MRIKPFMSRNKNASHFAAVAPGHVGKALKQNVVGPQTV